MNEPSAMNATCVHEKLPLCGSNEFNNIQLQASIGLLILGCKLIAI